MIRRPPRSTLDRSSAASDVYKRQGRAIAVDLFRGLTAEVLAELRAKVGEAFFAANNYELAARLFDEISVADQFTDFLTLKAYEYLN